MRAPKKKTLIFVRHGHRDTFDRSSDNGLTDKGFAQAKEIARFFSARFGDPHFQVFSSPKLRCKETIEPLADKFGKRVLVDEDLDEQLGFESQMDFNTRIQKCLKNHLQSKEEIVVLCSHGDWLPLAIFHLTGQIIDLKKGGWIELEYTEGKAEVQWVIQSFKHF